MEDVRRRMATAFLTMVLPLAAAEPPPEPLDEAEQALAEVRRTIDVETVSPEPPDARAAVMARFFGVEKALVLDLRSNWKLGWGTIAVELAMARSLRLADPETFPTTEKALERVQAVRADGKEWGRVAHELGLSLEPVLKSVRQAREELRALRPETEG